jgi:hypothetical protein
MMRGDEMTAGLPEPWRGWVTARAEALGLPNPDSYLHLLVRLDWQSYTFGRPFQLAYPAAEPAPDPDPQLVHGGGGG